ncbi:hypothetical protein GWI33_014521 [Rhynchophorus ferrugineus]|uniref:Uncharacterized protein n=1 Tax=Rhynchophorus ferrugineus TaxID=354439 RepID=A0A834I501_RHYFE|nr:hypothetical protein GWI33_014521 [Rhynchophorus ferrugineus]
MAFPVEKSLPFFPPIGWVLREDAGAKHPDTDLATRLVICTAGTFQLRARDSSALSRHISPVKLTAPQHCRIQSARGVRRIANQAGTTVSSVDHA